jgi:hypothetical protein
MLCPTYPRVPSLIPWEESPQVRPEYGLSRSQDSPRTRLPPHLLRKHEPSSRLTPERSQRSRVMRSARGVWSGGRAPSQNSPADGKVRGLVPVRVRADQWVVMTDVRPS